MNLYEKNIEALNNTHPALVEQLESVVLDESRIKILQTETGEPTLLYKADNGDEIYIHNADDPAKRASDAAELVGKLGDEGIVAHLGFGLGYFAEELYERFKKSDKFLSIIAHDLKNPFNLILGFVELLRKNYYKYDDERKFHFIESINRSTYLSKIKRSS